MSSCSFAYHTFHFSKRWTRKAYYVQITSRKTPPYYLNLMSALRSFQISNVIRSVLYPSVDNVTFFPKTSSFTKRKFLPVYLAMEYINCDDSFGKDLCLNKNCCRKRKLRRSPNSRRCIGGICDGLRWDLVVLVSRYIGKLLSENFVEKEIGTKVGKSSIYAKRGDRNQDVWI